MSRLEDFEAIVEQLGNSHLLRSADTVVYQGDSLDMLRLMPDRSISLILTDPPYHSTKKHNIRGDKDFSNDSDYIEWIYKYILEWRRILKPNGSLYCFCSSEMAAQIEIALVKKFNILSHIVWTKPNEPGYDGWKQKMKKESLRQWYAHSERIIFAEPAFDGNLHRSYFGHVLRSKRKEANLSGHQLTELTGAYGKVNHGGAVSNWETGRNIPSREQYSKISEVLQSAGISDGLPPYEDTIRPFDMDGSRQFTDIWTFPSVRPYKGKHPAEKPIDMLMHAISSSSYEGDIVLDCFAGSGSTAIAARNLGRLSISIELDETLAQKIADKLIVNDDPFALMIGDA